MEYSIVVEDVSYTYKSKKNSKLALNSINIKVQKGTIFGLIGPNGAGKSTLIKLMSTLLTPQSGNIKIMENDVKKHKKVVRENISLIYGGESGLYWPLTAMENLTYFGELNNVSNYKSKSYEILKTVGLYNDRNKKVANFSKGMKQRLHIARGLLNNPKVIFMDEPTLGLDLEISFEIRKIVKDLAVNQGKTIIYTSHYMNEVETLCDTVAFISNGRIIRLDNPDNLKEEMRNSNIYNFELEFIDDTDIQRLKQDSNIFDFIVTKNNIQIETSKQYKIHDLLRNHMKNSKIFNISIQEYNIENVYMELIGNKL